MGAICCFAVQIVLLQWYLKGQDARTLSFYISIGMTLVVTLYWWTLPMPWVWPVGNNSVFLDAVPGFGGFHVCAQHDNRHRWSAEEAIQRGRGCGGVAMITIPRVLV